MENLILGGIVFILIFIGRFVIYLMSRKSKKKKNTGSIAVDIKYLKNKFKLNAKKLDTMGIALLVSFTDALIIDAAFLGAIIVTDNIFLELAIGLVVVIVLIILVNEIIGKILIKKGYDK